MRSWRAILMAGALAQPAVAADIAALAADYGARPAARAVRLSPDGDKILYLAASGTQGTTLLTADIATGATKALLVASDAGLAPTRCEWKSQARIICSLLLISEINARTVYFARTLSIAADGSDKIVLGPKPSDKDVGIDQVRSHIIDYLPDDPDHVLMQIDVVDKIELGTNVTHKSGLSVQLVDVATNRMTMVERPNKQAISFASDDHGGVRYMATSDSDSAGFQRDNLNRWVRAKGSKDWQRLGATETLSDTQSEFHGFDESGDNFVVGRKLEGRLALYRVPTGPGGGSELIYASPQVDVDGLLRIGKYNRPVAASYTLDSDQYAFFDTALQRRAKALQGALPGKPPVYIADESWDGKRELIFAGGDSDPGSYYRFDTTTKQLNALLELRPQLSGRPAAVQTNVQYPAGDGTLIPAYLTLPPGSTNKGLPALLMPHGGPSARDARGFDWLAQFFAQAGYAVLQPNYRGSSGYGDAWYEQNGFKSWRTAIGDINDGARWLARQGIADPAKLAIFGWSYGGYAALQANVLDPTLYKAAVAVAPVTDLGLLKLNASHFTNYEMVLKFVGDGPHVSAGSPALHSDVIKVPVLIFHGDKDLNVDISQGRVMDAALGRAGKVHRLVVFPGLDHQLDDSAVRTRMLFESAEWLAAGIAGVAPK